MKSSRSVAGSYSEKGYSLADADQAAFGNGLFLLLFTGCVFHMRSNGTTGQVQAELLTAASSEQAVHIQPGEVIQKDERRRVPGEPIADVGGAAMDQGAIQFDEAELQGGKHWEIAFIHSVEQCVDGIVAMLLAQRLCVLITAQATDQSPALHQRSHMWLASSARSGCSKPWLSRQANTSDI